MLSGGARPFAAHAQNLLLLDCIVTKELLRCALLFEPDTSACTSTSLLSAGSLPLLSVTPLPFFDCALATRCSTRPFTEIPTPPSDLSVTLLCSPGAGAEEEPGSSRSAAAAGARAAGAPTDFPGLYD